MPSPEERPSFEVLEHTADIGLRVRGRTIEELFENTIRGLLEILGAHGVRGGRVHRVVVPLDAGDPGGMLVDLLNEVIYLVDRDQARILEIDVASDGSSVVAQLEWAPSTEPLPGTELKAATYHQLKVEETDAGYEATVFFDV
jgi:SHS2 domain-containing protein